MSQRFLNSAPKPLIIDQSFMSRFIDRKKASSISHVLGAGQVCAWGTLYYCFPLIAIEMGKDLGWSKEMIYFGASLGMLINALCAYPVGIVFDRGYCGWLMSIASLLASVMLAFWSKVTTIEYFYAISICIGALQACTLYEAAFAVISNAVESTQIRSRITVITLWGGFASTVFIPMEQYLINEMGWRTSLQCLCLINLFWAFLYFFTIRNAKNSAVTNFQSEKSKKIENQSAVKSALHNSVFWLLLIALTLYSVTFTVFIFHAYPILQEKGLSSVDAVKVLMVLGPIQVLGRMLISQFASRVPVRIIGSVFALVFPLVFIGLLFVKSNDLFIFMFFIACYGLSNGIFTIVRGLVVPEMVSRQAYGAINGLITIPMMIARAVGPGVAASLWMLHQSYQDVLMLVILVSLTFAIAFWSAAWISRTRKDDSGD